MNKARFTAILFVIFLPPALSACQDRSTPQVTVGDIGDPCTADFNCKPELACAHSGTCQDPGDRQKGTVAEGGSCATEECRYGLACCTAALSGATGCAQNTCVAPGDENDRCTATEDCRLGLVCNEQSRCTPDGVGRSDEPCALAEECAFGFICVSEGVCARNGNGAAGSVCYRFRDCAPGLTCCDESLAGQRDCYVNTCVAVGGEGEGCMGTEDCGADLLCAGDGTCVDPGDPTAPARGIGDFGEACTAEAGCRMGMNCFLDDTCQPVRYWPGAYCAPDDPAGDFKVYYEIPSLPLEGEMDFYRLPFPNDIRIRGGRVQLDGHPVPDVPIADEAVNAWLGAVDDHATGFSTQPTVFMRFSKSPDFGTIRLASVCETCEAPAERAPDCPSGCAQWLHRNFYIVNITPPADPADPAYMGYGEGMSFGMSITTGRGRYICQNFIALRPADGSPLRPGATYAVIVTDTDNPAEGIRTAAAEGAESLVQDDDFAKLVEGIATGDCAGAAGGNADIESACNLPGYRWLADYLDDSSQLDHDANWRVHLRAAAVFTTMKPADAFAGFREKINDCTGGDCVNLPEPTPEGGTINDPLSRPAFEVHDGALRMPIFQSGTPPYESAPDGEVQMDASGAPRLVAPASSSFARVNFSMSVPDSPDKPADGWPVVIVMPDVLSDPDADACHEFIRNGAAEALSSADIELGDPPALQTARFAVLGFDPVMHGSRRGDSTADPAHLFYNLMNPYAASGNAMQSAADGYQIIRLIQLLHQTFLDGGGLAGFEGVDVDPNQIYLLAHGEGARSAVIFTAFEPLVRAAAVSQVGGPLISNLTRQTAPFDFPGILEVMVAEKNPGTMHPIVSLMQMVLDPVDPINYGNKIIWTPPQIGETTDDPPLPIYAGPHNLFMVFGRDDPAAPESSMFSLIAVLGIAQFDNDTAGCHCGDLCDAPGSDGLHDAVCTIGGIDSFADNIRGNARGGTITGALTILVGGHDVMFEDADAVTQYSGFLASAFLDPEGIPTIFAP
jgi:hypothetical protein